MSGPQLALDLRCLFGSNGRRGIGVFSLGLARATRDAGVPVTFLAPPEHLGTARAAEIDLPLEPCDRTTLERIAAAGPTIFHSASLYEFPVGAPVIPEAVTRLGLPVTATLYDAIPYAEPERYQPTPELRRFYAQRAMLLRSCDRLLAISAFAADSTAELLQVSRDRIAVVGVGVGTQYRPVDPAHQGELQAVHRRLGVRAPYVVCVAGNDPRKNVAGLTSAWGRLPAELRRSHQLVVVGAIEAHHQEAWRNGLRLGDELVYSGELTDAEVVEAVRHAELSAFPSLLEGFGLPVAEAAACDIPAICSDRTSMPEILELPAATFDPTDPAAMATVLARALTDQGFRDDLRDAGRRAAERWRWDRCAAAAVAAWTGVVERRRPARAAPSPRRTRLAVVGPFGGSPSGIGTYNERLLPHLDRHAEVTCFVEQFWGEAPLGVDGRRYPVDALGRHLDPATFDHVVYTLGNSPFHLSSVRRLRDVPGHVWFHEAQLAELHIGTAHLFRDQVWAERFLDEAVCRDHGPAMVDELRREAGWDGMLDVDRYHRLGVRLLGPVADAAQSVIVSSDVAAGIIRHAPPGYQGDVLVLPIAFPEPAPFRPTVPAGRDIAVLGWLSPRKGLAQGVRVLRRLRDVVPGTRLVFVGKALDGSLEALAAALAAHGLPADAAEITGFVPDAELAPLLQRCRAGLRLAERTDGEMSAAITDLVALGVPTVTNLISMGATSAGLRVLTESSDDDLVDSLVPLLGDDDEYLASHRDAGARAAAWGFAEVAERLMAWLENEENREHFPG